MTTKSKYTDDDLELLSDQEREALEEDGDYIDDGEDNSDDTISAAAADDTTDADPDGGADDDPAPAAKQQDAPPPATQDTEDPDDAAPGNAGRQDAPDAAAIDAIETKITKLKDDRKKLLADWQDGEIDDEEYAKRLDDIETGIETSARDLGKLQHQAEAANSVWYDAVNRHLKAYPEIAQNNAFLEAIDAQQQALAKQPSFANRSYDELLKAAHGIVAANAENLGIPGFPQLRTGTNKQPAPKADPKPAPKQNKGLSDPPTTLRDTPTASPTNPDESEFAALDGLGPIEREAAIAAMTPQKREEYMRYS